MSTINSVIGCILSKPSFTFCNITSDSFGIRWFIPPDNDQFLLHTASSYDIRFSTNFKQLRSSFGQASRLNDTDIIVGNLSSPSAATEKEIFVVRFPPGYTNVTLFFGLMVNHSGGRISEVSNIVSAAIVYVPPRSAPTKSESDSTSTADTTTRSTTITTTTSTTQTPTMTAQQPDAVQNSAEEHLVVKLAVGFVMPIIIIIIIAIVIKLKYSRNPRRNSGNEEDGLRENNSPVGNTSQYSVCSPYSNPAGTIGNTSQYSGFSPYSNQAGTMSVVVVARPIYLPAMNPHQVHGCGGLMPNRPPQYGHPPDYQQEFGWVASR